MMSLNSAKAVFLFGLFSLGLLGTSPTFAAGELLPNLKNDIEKRTFVGKVQRQLPFAGRNNLDTLNMQIRGIEALKSQFPEYTKMMAEKPGPYTFDIVEIEETKEQIMQLEESRFKGIQAVIEETFASELKQLPAESLKPTEHIQKLRERALLALSASLDHSSESVRGILVGLAQLLPNEDKPTFFKLGDPQAQLDYLAQKNWTDEVIKASKFRAETVGLTTETLTVAKVFEIARQRNGATHKIFAVTSYLQALEKLAKLDAKSQIKILTTGKGLAGLLAATDFDFAFKNNSPLVNQLIKEVSVLSKKPEGTARQLFETFQNGFSRLHFKSETRTLSQQKLLGKVFEVHPYLGINRGCIGGDCSTSNSPMFPYSPNEHVFFIQNSNGQFVGYITATRVKQKETPSLYIKDITGPNLSPALLESILHVLHNSLHLYGVKQLILARPDFTNSQNNHIPLREVLGRYNKGKLESLVIPDAKIRNSIGSNYNIFRSTMSYDDPKNHSTGVIFQPNATIASRVTQRVSQEKLPVLDAKALSKLILEGINTYALKMPNEVHLTVGAGPLNVGELTNALQIFKNQSALPLTQYYQSVAAYLKTLGIKMTPQFIQQNESLFYFGHLNAPDSFTTKNEKLRSYSERYFGYIVRDGKHPMTMLTFFKKNGSEIEKTSTFQEILKEYSDKMESSQVIQLASFAELGSESAKKLLKRPKFQSNIENAIEDLVKMINYPVVHNERFYQVIGNGKEFASFAIDLKNTYGIRYAEYEAMLEKRFSMFQIDWKTIQNPTLRRLIAIGFLKSSDVFKAGHKTQAVRLFKDLVANDQLEALDILIILRKLMESESFTALAPMVKKRLKVLLDRKSEIAMIEIHALHALGFEQATEVLNRPDIKDLNTQTVLKSLKPQSLENTNSILIMNSFQMFQNTKYIDLLSARNIFNEHLPSASAAMKRLREAFEYLGVSIDQIIESPTIHALLAPRWFSYPDAFASSDPSILRLSSILVTLNMKNNYFNIDTMLPHIAVLKQANLFENLVQSTLRQLQEGNCHSCAQSLAKLFAYGYIDKNRLAAPETLNALLNAPHITPRNLGLAMAIEHGRQDLVPDAAFGNFVAEYSRLGEEIHATSSVHFKETLLKSIEKANGLSRANREQFLKIAESEPLHALAFSAANTFVKNGGSPQRAISALNAKYERPQYQPNYANVLSCKGLFNAR